jgi:hypothetical protein
VILDASDPLPDRLQIMVVPRGQAAPAREDGFRARGAAVQPGRTVIANLPAMELSLFVMGMGEWNGRADIATITGQTIEVHVAMKKAERNGR